MSEKKVLREKGSFDYDYVNDILFFKVDEREYSHSMELLGYVIDVDTEGYVVGLQIFGASTYFSMSKDHLRKVVNWKLDARVVDGVLEIKLMFTSVLRNRIVEKNPILVQNLNNSLPNSEVFCVVN